MPLAYAEVWFPQARQADAVEVLHEKQVDTELLKRMSAKANAIEPAFNVYRTEAGGKEMTDSEVRKVLKESYSGLRRAV